MNTQRHLLGALKVGHTELVCATGYEDGTIVAREEIPMASPEEAIPAVSKWFVNKGVAAVGICTFGPTGVDVASPDYGKLSETGTTADEWRGYDLLGTLRSTLGVPCGYDTDVNAACLAESAFGGGRGLDDLVYVCVGSGVGVGVMVDGEPLHGMLHPEAGHVPVTPDPRDPLAQRGVCPCHENCLEGYLSEGALEARWPGMSLDEVAGNAGAMDILAGYLAQGLAIYALCYSPRKIIVGGSVVDGTGIVPLAREKARKQLNGYLVSPELEDFGTYIVHSGLNGSSEIMGCLELARRTLRKRGDHVPAMER